MILQLKSWRFLTCIHKDTMLNLTPREYKLKEEKLLKEIKHIR